MVALTGYPGRGTATEQGRSGSRQPVPLDTGSWPPKIHGMEEIVSEPSPPSPRRQRRYFVLVALVFVALGAAGCGGGDDKVGASEPVTTADGMYVYPEAVKTSFRKAFVQGRGEPWITTAQCILDYAQAHWTVEKFQSVAAGNNPDRQAAVNACQP